MTTTVKCPNCGNSIHKILKTFQYESIMQCDKCTLVVKSNFICSRNKIQILQDDEYYDPYARARSKINFKMAKDRVDMLKAYISSGRLLEIGSATGEFLEAAVKQGFVVLGVDASRQYCEYTTEKGLNIKCGRLEDINVDKKSFDVIAVFHLIEHIEEPLAFLNLIYGYLKDGGVLFIVTPNVDSFTNKIFGYNHPVFTQRDHLLFYSKQTLSGLLEKANYKVVALFSKEYSHHFFTSLLGVVKNYIKDKLPYAKKSSCESSVANKNRRGIKEHIKYVVNEIPYACGFVLCPLLKIYGKAVDVYTRGHELIVIAKK